MEQQTAFTETVGMTTYTVTVRSTEKAKEKPEQQFSKLILDELFVYLDADEADGAKTVDWES